MKKLISLLLCLLLVCAMLPMSAFAAETGKLAAVEFTPSDTLSDTFVAVTAAKGAQGETPVFTLDSGNSITVTAKNGALVQEVYLTDYVEASQGGSTTHAGLAVAARVALGVLVTEDPSAPPAAETPALSVSASEGQIAREDGFYSVKGINAGSVTVSATDAHSFSAITVAYSLDLTKQEIIDAINEKGTAFKAERETYKAAKSVFDEANKTFEPAKSPLNAYEQAKAEWEKAESAHQELINKLDAAKSELQSAKDAYPAARDEYLALRARAQALGLTEAQGLPAEIKENEALAELFTAPDPSSLPVPLGTAERSFYASDVGTETEGITISARKMGNTISLNIGSPITMSNSVGEIKSVYMVRSPDSMGGGNLSLKGTPGTYYYNNNQNAQYSITNVNSPDYPRNIILLNFAYGREPQLSYGATYIREKQWGLFASISTSFNFRAAATDLVCDRDGDLVEGYNGSGHGGIPFSSEKSHSRFSILAGATFLLFPEWGIQAGIGYGQRDLGWKLRQPLNGEEWVRCEEYCVRGIELSVGTHFNLKHTSASFDIVTTMFKRLEFRIGAGINF